MKKIICILLCTFALVSCDYKVHIRECSLENREGNALCVFWNNKPYNGELWSDDEKSMCLICEKGIAKSLTMYHVNGKTAILMDCAHLELEPICFDINGNRISGEKFGKDYADYAAKFVSLLEYELGSNVVQPTNSSNMPIDTIAADY